MGHWTSVAPTPLLQPVTSLPVGFWASAVGHLVEGGERCEHAALVRLHDVSVLDHLVQDDVDSVQVEHDLMTTPSQRNTHTHKHTWHLRIRQEVLTHRHGNRQQMRKDTSSSLCGDKQRHSDQTGGRTGQQTWCSDDQVHPNSPPGWSIYPKPPRSYEPARRRTARSEETNFIWVFPFYATFNL